VALGWLGERPGAWVARAGKAERGKGRREERGERREGGREREVQGRRRLHRGVETHGWQQGKWRLGLGLGGAANGPGGL
jgi:hypothetical protein